MMSKALQPRSLALASLAAVGWLLFLWTVGSRVSGPLHAPAPVAAFPPPRLQSDHSADPDQVGAIPLSTDELRRTLPEPAPPAPAHETVDCRHTPGCNALLLAEARDRLKQMLDAKATQQRDKAEHDKVLAETAAARQSAEVLKQQVAQLDAELAGRKDEQAKLDKETADLKAGVVSSTSERDEAAGAASRAKAERDRIVADTAAAQKDAEALKQQVAELNVELAGRKDEQAKLDKEATDLKTGLASLTAESRPGRKGGLGGQDRARQGSGRYCRRPAARRGPEAATGRIG